MASLSDTDRLYLPRRNVRLHTLVRLRWLSIMGQTLAVLIVYFGLGFDLPLWACLAVIALSTSLNAALHLQLREARRFEPERAAWLLAFDVAELTALLFLTGGQENPFSFLLLGPVLLAATALPARMTILLGIFTVVCATLILYFHYPLPWSADVPLNLPDAYVIGVWISVLLAMAYIGIYGWQISEESRQLVSALAATELALAHEKHLSQLDGLAAAAAHALGTPLSTISVVARELERAIDPKSPHAEDVRLLREQAQRCRDILGKLNELSAEGEPFAQLALSSLLEEVAAPHRDFGIAIDVVMPEGEEPFASRNPALIYGLGNLVENAVDFARERVEIAARWSEDEVVVTISDDGPGFTPQVLSQIGEPYISGGPRRRMYASGDTGLGLGVFIAKTLLERTGAKLTFLNRQPPEHGAVVTVHWTRAEFDRRVANLALENRLVGA
jgi:two-component system sensor histidine kinase RegB